MATADDLLAAAVQNNAAWCAAVCRSHGIATHQVAGWSFADAPAPTYHPDAVSLSEHADAGALPQRTPLAVKDSFATLRLQPYGFRVLLEGAWLQFHPDVPVDGWQQVTAADLDGWKAAHGGAPAIEAALLDDTDVRVLMTLDGTAGLIASRAAGVVGVSNVFGPTAVWRTGPAAAAAAWPGLPVVGWESGGALTDAIRAGHQVLGPMRVWLRD